MSGTSGSYAYDGICAYGQLKGAFSINRAREAQYRQDQMLGRDAAK